MRAVIAERFGGPEVLALAERADPRPGPGELVVRLAAAGVNYKDVYEREGRGPLPAPLVVGCEGAGTVLATGPGVSAIAPGDRVAWWAAPGSYAEQVVVPARAAVPLPADITEEAAAAVLLQGLTAHYLTTSTYRAAAGECALVPAAAGGLGQQLARVLARRGVHVIGTVSTEAKAAVATAAGVRDVLVVPPGGFGDGEQVAARVRELTGGRGVDVVYDGVGRDTFRTGLAALRRRGTFVLVGAASGPVPPFDPQLLAAAGSLFLTRPTLVDHATEPAELAERAGEVFAWLRDGTLSAEPGGRYPLARAAAAHADLEGRRTTGKLLLVPSA
ncbi:NADPH:quinone reductase [Streptomyces tateyamensis]|uniref:NADPH:quinone reductase n=1 Tax=Streptomyces tateyamensis TaxID=565073 RepID=A0A2V4NQB3_9ACTN|nr:quinone oxidoreductase [Streptomyces tateyamensis]PYC83176.1 NADPH:quinone reductase [Streptomyces tateyamensis]